jgi:hypothetical protein
LLQKGLTVRSPNRFVFVFLSMLFALGAAMIALPLLTNAQETTPEVPSDFFACSAGIEAGLTDGPHAPMDLSGNFVLIVNPDDLTFYGSLTLNSGEEIGITGQSVGRGIDIVFQTAEGELLFAHGSLQAPLSECSGNAGGPLVGPDFGDQGDWTTRPPFIRIICTPGLDCPTPPPLPPSPR